MHCLKLHLPENFTFIQNNLAILICKYLHAKSDITPIGSHKKLSISDDTEPKDKWNAQHYGFRFSF